MKRVIIAIQLYAIVGCYRMADCREFKRRFTLKEMTITDQSDDVGQPGNVCSSTVELPDNKIVCVEYPAVVLNVTRMLETIGGEEGVSRVSRLT